MSRFESYDVKITDDGIDIDKYTESFSGEKQTFFIPSEIFLQIANFRNETPPGHQGYTGYTFDKEAKAREEWGRLRSACKDFWILPEFEYKEAFLKLINDSNSATELLKVLGEKNDEQI